MKRLCIFLALILGLTSFAIAEECASNHMKDQTVEEINQLEEGESVKLEGVLNEHEEENIYLYKDDTGEIKVEVSPEVWQEEYLEFSPDQKYEIKGELVKENETLHVKAEKIEEAKAKEQLPEEAQEGQQKAEEERQDDTQDEEYLF